MIQGEGVSKNLQPCFIYFCLFIGYTGSCFCVWTFSRCGDRGLLLCCGAWSSYCGGFSCSRAWALEHVDFFCYGLRALVCRFSGFWRIGSIALWHVESSQTRDRTHVSCIDRQILHHWSTREVLQPGFKITIVSESDLGRILLQLILCISED